MLLVVDNSFKCCPKSNNISSFSPDQDPPTSGADSNLNHTNPTGTSLIPDDSFATPSSSSVDRGKSNQIPIVKFLYVQFRMVTSLSMKQL